MNQNVKELGVELINNEYFIGGVAVGALFSLLIYILTIPCITLLLKERRRNEHYLSLLKKLSKSNYAVYAPILMRDNLQLNDELTSEERTILNTKTLMIFKNGQPVTKLIPQIGFARKIWIV